MVPQQEGILSQHGFWRTLTTHFEVLRKKTISYAACHPGSWKLAGLSRRLLWCRWKAICLHVIASLWGTWTNQSDQRLPPHQHKECWSDVCGRPVRDLGAKEINLPHIKGTADISGVHVFQGLGFCRTLSRLMIAVSIMICQRASSHELVPTWVGKQVMQWRCR